MSCLSDSSLVDGGSGTPADLEVDPRIVALDAALKAAAELNAAAARLAEVLPTIKEQGYWKGEFASLSEYLSEGLKLKPAAANELIRVAGKLEAAGVSPEAGQSLGFHKLAIVHKHVTEQNKATVLQDVAELDAKELKQRYQPARPALPRTSPAVNSRTPTPRTLDLSGLKQTALKLPEADSSTANSPNGDSRGVNYPPEAAEFSVEDFACLICGNQPDNEPNAMHLFAFALFRSQKFTRNPSMNANLEYIAREFLKTHPDPAAESVAEAAGCGTP